MQSDVFLRGSTETGVCPAVHAIPTTGIGVHPSNVVEKGKGTTNCMGAPTDYLDRYHRLQVTDAKLNISETLNVTNYNSGDAPDRSQEQWILIDALRRIIDPKAKSLPARFYFPNGDPTMNPLEVFFFQSIRRTFLGKGSPDEITDTLRLAGSRGPRRAERRRADIDSICEEVCRH
jgi:hypothetical protein